MILFRRLIATNSDPHAKSRGYTLSVLLIMIVALGVFMQRAHLWAPTQINREREAELIYRGEHLARGIAIYRQKTGRYPISLTEVAALRPRIIRQAYKDPMSEKGEWMFIYNVPTSTSGNNEGLPIIGLHSSSNRDSIKLYRNKSLYSEWEFSALDPLITGIRQDQVPQGAAQIPTMSQQGGQDSTNQSSGNSNSQSESGNR
jgi:hypothetical protein